MELTFKVCLVGPAKSGMKEIINNEIYSSTSGVSIYSIRKRDHIINLWDIGSVFTP
uniref:Ras family GTPase n=1 Tax=Pithovirus LCPAC401 TaxID=2506595 RepID=A0A481ZA15_9VIRU|nr:MAG: hypothetical protein LCPAC401_03860 [Pithovirus LCPAC401]